MLHILPYIFQCFAAALRKFICAFTLLFVYCLFNVERRRPFVHSKEMFCGSSVRLGCVTPKNALFIIR